MLFISKVLIPIYLPFKKFKTLSRSKIFDCISENINLFQTNRVTKIIYGCRSFIFKYV